MRRVNCWFAAAMLSWPGLRLAAQASAPATIPAGPKSPAFATLLSDLGTAVPLLTGIGMGVFKPAAADAGPGRASGYERAIPILIGVGALVGPSVGHFYAHRTGWLVTRTVVGGGLVLVGERIHTDTRAAFYGAALLVVGITMVEDLGTAGDAARVYNLRHARAGLTLRPLPGPGSGRLGIGLRIPR